jgi:XisH protein
MAKDFFHLSVIEALQKDGWTITHDPYLINHPQLKPRQEIDLGAEKILGAERGTEKVAIEIKSFIQHSLVYEFHSAVGQYLNYLIGLQIQEPDRILYLAIPDFAYDFIEEMALLKLSIST